MNFSMQDSVCRIGRKGTPFEVRTTVHADFLNEAKIEQMAQILWSEGYRGVYYLQGFLPTVGSGSTAATAAHDTSPLFRKSWR